MNNLYQIAAVAAFSWALAFALYQLAHALGKNLDFRIRYVIGAAVLCLVSSIAGLLLGDALLMVIPWVLASAGATVLINYYFEGKRAERDAAERRNGELVGRLGNITQDLIDDWRKDGRN